MKHLRHMRLMASWILIICLLASPVLALGKKGEKNFKRGLEYEAAQQWERAAQEFALAVAASPSNIEYQLHYRRAVFNASQSLMQQGRSLAERGDYIGAYNAFRQAYAYDPVNELALSEMARMMRLQSDKENGNGNNGNGTTGAKVSQTSYRSGNGVDAAKPSTSTQGARKTTTQQETAPPRTEQLRVVNYSGDLKAFIRTYAEILGLNVIFDTQSFRQPRNIEINLRDVTAAQALDWVFLQEGLFFQRLGRRTIIVADQTRRANFQQLVIRTFYLQNIKPADAQKVIQSAIPAQAGRPPATVITDNDTNSLTVRDTPENIRLYAELLQALDKDRAEVVMDVNIYEVSRSDLLQFGNQIGTDSQLLNLGTLQGGITNRATGPTLAFPTALGVGIALPPSTIAALQRKDRTRLVASTQVHAFNGEESQARIGQRVPVQTAQTFPFGTTSGTTTPTTGVSTGVGFAGGFPVFNYEPTGLTLKFTPQVFPNQDVQVKMSIESKDVLNPGSPTPTFTERTISGTARIQNNRTMLLASIAQDRESQGRAGLPLLGLIPILGRLFTAPRRDNSQIDIVIAVTPRVLRAPDVTPLDEEMRPSGTLQTPTTGSLEALLREAEREDQLAAAQTQTQTQTQAQTQTTTPTRPASNNVVVEVDVPREEALPTYVPSPKILMPDSSTANNSSATLNVETAISAAKTIPTNIKSQPLNVSSAIASLTSGAPTQTTSAALTTKTVSSSSESAAKQTTTTNAETSSASSEAQKTGADKEKSLAGNQQTQTVERPIDISSNVKTLATKPTVSSPDTTDSSTEPQTPAQVPLKTQLTTAEQTITKVATGNIAAATSAAELRLVPEQNEMRVGETRRLAIVLKTDAPLGMAALTLRFDPKTIGIKSIKQGNLFAYAQGAQPVITPSVNASGLLLVSITPPAGAGAMTGAGVLIFIDIEAVGAGETAISFDKDNMHLIATDGRGVLLQLVQSRVTVKQ